VSRSVALLLTCLLCAGCAEGTLVFGVNPNPGTSDNIVVSGDIDDVTPPNVQRDLVVFVFTNVADPGTWTDYDDAEAVVVEASSSAFTVDDISPGGLSVVFLLDDTDPDGSIDAGDPVAVLSDPEGRLDNVSPSRLVELSLVDLDFNNGTATADTITVSALP